MGNLPPIYSPFNGDDDQPMGFCTVFSDKSVGI